MAGAETDGICASIFIPLKTSYRFSKSGSLPPATRLVAGEITACPPTLKPITKQRCQTSYVLLLLVSAIIVY